MFWTEKRTTNNARYILKEKKKKGKGKISYKNKTTNRQGVLDSIVRRESFQQSRRWLKLTTETPNWLNLVNATFTDRFHLLESPFGRHGSMKVRLVTVKLTWNRLTSPQFTSLWCVHFPHHTVSALQYSKLFLFISFSGFCIVLPFLQIKTRI